MPHLVILYTGNLDAVTDMSVLCRSLADAMQTVRDDAGKQVFPTGGTRVLAYPAPHFAPLLASRPVGVTLQIDEGPEVFDAKNSSLHPLFSKPA